MRYEDGELERKCMGIGEKMERTWEEKLGELRGNERYNMKIKKMTCRLNENVEFRETIGLKPG